uniref:Uncharacterized protein n=1 Tax=Arundo donax TaxID=35708 RepID=A0A0A9FC62_ARUDO
MILKCVQLDLEPTAQNGFAGLNTFDLQPTARKQQN